MRTIYIRLLVSRVTAMFTRFASKPCPALCRLGRKSIRNRTAALMLLIGGLVPLSVLAAWTGLGGVTQVYSHNGTHFIQTTISEAACGTAGKFYWQAADSDAGDMLAIVLAALTADKQIRVSGNFSDPACLYGGAEITHLMISK